MEHRDPDNDQQLARRIRAAGIPICVKTEGYLPQLLIRQHFESFESTIFDFNGVTGLILPLKVTLCMPIFVFCGFNIVLNRWPDVWFRPLEENVRGEWPHYEFPNALSTWKFDRSQVLNRFIEKQQQCRRGQLLSGLLLAFTYDPLPEGIVPGEVLEGTITIIDQFEHEHPAEIRLRVDRNAARKNEPKQQRHVLFGRSSPR